MSLFDKLKEKPVSNATCLLLDHSGSMAWDDEGEGTRISLLRKAVQALGKKVVMFGFNDTPWLMETLTQSEPHGGTEFAPALRMAKKFGHLSAVLITDGECSDAQFALEEARGMHLDIIYVGTGEIPEILRKLSRTAHKGTVQIGKLEEQQQLTQTIAGYLT